MGFRLVVIVMVLILLASIPSLSAHHSSATYIDYTKTIAITGVITRIEWNNPHVRVYMTAKDRDGKISSWVVGLAPPNGLSKVGFDKSLVNLSDPITMEAWGPKDGKKVADGSFPAEGQTLTLMDGRKFDVSDKWLQLK